MATMRPGVVDGVTIPRTTALRYPGRSCSRRSTRVNVAVPRSNMRASTLLSVSECRTGWPLGRRTLGLHLFRRNAAASVAPAVEHVRDDVGNRVVGELALRWHHPVVGCAIDRQRAAETIQGDLDRTLRFLREQVGAGQWRENAGQTSSRLLMTG